MKKQAGQFLTLAMALALAAPALAQEPEKATPPAAAAAQESQPKAVVSAEKQKTKGVIIKRDADSFVLRDQSGADVTVMLTANTKVKEKKSNPFRSGKNYATTQLLRGLNVEVEGRGDNAGGLVAQEIRFTDDDFHVAQMVESRVNPVEGRLAENEQNAQRLSGQLEELGAISNAARGGAKAAQETADAAMTGVKENAGRIAAADNRISATNERITAVDDYQAKQVATINFKMGSAALSREAKTALDSIADQVKSERAFLIEVAGFASSDGGRDLNRRLSMRRADAVVRYLAENHMIPLRRMITPFGYGEAQPVADNHTREGRQQNRRVEVRILVSRGLSSSG